MLFRLLLFVSVLEAFLKGLECGDLFGSLLIGSVFFDECHDELEQFGGSRDDVFSVALVFEFSQEELSSDLGYELDSLLGHLVDDASQP